MKNVLVLLCWWSWTASADFSSSSFCTSFGLNYTAEIICLRNKLALCTSHEPPTGEDVWKKEESNNQDMEVRTEGKVDEKTALGRHPRGSLPQPSHLFLSGPFSHLSHSSHLNSATIISASPVPSEVNVNSTNAITKELKVNEDLEESLRVKLTRELNGKLNDLSRHLEERITFLKKKTDSAISRLEKKLRLLTSRVHRRWNRKEEEYIVVREAESWYEAEEQCVAWGGHLVSIHSHSDNSFIRDLVPSDGIWIGLNDVQTEAQFVFTDQTPFNFANWLRGEPDNVQHNENCILMVPSGEWADSLCLLRRSFACKR